MHTHTWSKAVLPPTSQRTVHLQYELLVKTKFAYYSFMSCGTHGLLCLSFCYASWSFPPFLFPIPQAAVLKDLCNVTFPSYYCPLHALHLLILLLYCLIPVISYSLFFLLFFHFCFISFFCFFVWQNPLLLGIYHPFLCLQANRRDSSISRLFVYFYPLTSALTCRCLAFLLNCRVPQIIAATRSLLSKLIL